MNSNESKNFVLLLNNDQKEYLLKLFSHNINGYKLLSLDQNEGKIVLSNGVKEIKLKHSDLMNNNNNNNNLETSDMDEINSEADFSSTSVLPNPNPNPNTNPNTNTMQGGFFSKNNLKYSETSSFKMSEMYNNSDTSSEMFNGRSDKYSDTSEIVHTGGKFNYSSDTLMDLSELRQRKTPKSSTNLDMGIFTKKVQSGGSVNSIRKKMMDVGINSDSSTSNICE
jgi:hypothetical protein